MSATFLLLHTFLPWPRANLEHSVPAARSARSVSLRAAHADARGSPREHDPNGCFAKAKNIVAVLQGKAQDHPEPSHRKEIRKENEFYTDQKGNRGDVANH
jgi:hypothetical protein